MVGPDKPAIPVQCCFKLISYHQQGMYMYMYIKQYHLLTCVHVTHVHVYTQHEYLYTYMYVIKALVYCSRQCVSQHTHTPMYITSTPWITGLQCASIHTYELCLIINRWSSIPYEYCRLQYIKNNTDINGCPCVIYSCIHCCRLCLSLSISLSLSKTKRHFSRCAYYHRDCTNTLER